MIPAFATAHITVYAGDVREALRALPAESVDCVVTSPPYWGLRDYGVAGQIGLERTPPEFINVMVEVFREVRRVLRPHGTLWLNLGDSYLSRPDNFMRDRRGHNSTLSGLPGPAVVLNAPHRKPQDGIKPKDMVGIPWRVAFALQEDGWYLRSEIIWYKPNAMPEAVRDRPAKAHETVFLLAKNARYHYDAEAIAEPVSGTAHPRGHGVNPKAAEYPGIGQKHAGERLVRRGDGETQYEGRSMHVRTRPRQNESFSGAINELVAIRNSRTVWSIPTQPHPEAHFATFPDELARRCIKAGCPEQVCTTCGKPRTRIIDVDYNAVGRTTNGPRSAERKHIEYGTAGFDQRLEKRVATRGFTDCGHGAYLSGVVLDPFAGSGTTLAVARDLDRRAIGIEINPEYVRLIEKRCAQLAMEFTA